MSPVAGRLPLGLQTNLVARAAQRPRHLALFYVHVEASTRDIYISIIGLFTIDDIVSRVKHQ